MNSIVQKIVVPVSVALIIVYIILIVLVSNFSSKIITSVYKDNFEVIVNQLVGNIERQDQKLTDLETLKREAKKTKISSLVDSAISMVNLVYNKYNSGLISEQTAKNEAKNLIRNLSYDKTGYYWIDNTDYILQVNPPDPSAEGSNRSTLIDKKGTYMVKIFVDQSIKNGEAYVNYWFPKPGESEPSEKLGHTKIFKPWNWVIGTGFYIDEIAKEIEALRLSDLYKFNKIIQSKNIEGIYPLIFTRDSIIISTPNEENLLKKIVLLDSTTGENIIKKSFVIKNGIFEYNTLNRDKKNIKKIAYCRYYKELDWIVLYTQDKSMISDSVNQLRNIIILIAIVSVILGILMLTFRSRSVVKNLKIITDRVNDISEGDGDLTQKILVTNSDESGLLAGYFNNFISKLRTIIIEIKGVGTESAKMGNTLASNAEELSATVEEISSTMRSIDNKTTLLSNEVQSSNKYISEIKDNIKNLQDYTHKESNYVAESSSAIEQMIASIDTISQISQDKNKSIMGLTKIAKSGERDMDLTVKAITNIEESSTSMLNMISVITDVSDRINLLAMNAAIEAAHAGEAGKGFAVVADEIRKLAAVTAQSTNDMTITLTKISNSIIDASKLSDNTGKTIKTITMEVIDVSESLSEMIHSFTELSTGTTHITDALSLLVDTSKDVMEASNHIDNVTIEIQGSLHNVTQLTDQNRNGISEITTGITDISTALNGLSDLSNSNSENIKSLNSILENFKT